MNGVWNWINTHSIIRRIVLFITLWMTWEAFVWAKEYAEFSELPGIEMAAVMGAVTAPITLLQGFVFKVYAEGRKE